MEQHQGQEEGADALPEELTAALAARAEVRARFDSLPPSHRREYARFVDGAVKPETRRRRAEKAVEMIVTATARAR